MRLVRRFIHTAALVASMCAAVVLVGVAVVPASAVAGGSRIAVVHPADSVWD